MCSVRYYANLRLWSVISNESRSTKSGTTKKELNFYKFMITVRDMGVRIQLRNDLAINWSTKNPILAQG